MTGWLRAAGRALRRFGAGYPAIRLPIAKRPAAPGPPPAVRVSDPATRARWWRLLATLDERLSILEADAKNKRREA